MTQYYVDMSQELVKELLSDDSRNPVGWRLVRRWGPRDKYTERWVVSDENADEELQDCLVMPTFQVAANSRRSVVVDRQVVSVHPLL